MANSGSKYNIKITADIKDVEAKTKEVQNLLDVLNNMKLNVSLGDKLESDISETSKLLKELFQVDGETLNLNGVSESLAKLAEYFTKDAEALNEAFKPDMSGLNEVQGVLKEISSTISTIRRGLNLQEIIPVDSAQANVNKLKNELSSLVGSKEIKEAQDVIDNMQGKSKGLRIKTKYNRDNTSREQQRWMLKNLELYKEANNGTLKGLDDFSSGFKIDGTIFKDIDKLYTALNNIPGLAEEVKLDIQSIFNTSGTSSKSSLIKNVTEGFTNYRNKIFEVKQAEEDLAIATANADKSLSVTFDEKAVQTLSKAIGSLDAKIPEGSTFGLDKNTIDAITKSISELSKAINQLRESLSKGVTFGGFAEEAEEILNAGSEVEKTSEATAKTGEGAEKAAEGFEKLATSAEKAGEATKKTKDFQFKIDPKNAEEIAKTVQQIVTKLKEAEEEIKVISESINTAFDVKSTVTTYANSVDALAGRLKELSTSLRNYNTTIKESKTKNEVTGEVKLKGMQNAIDGVTTLTKAVSNLKNTLGGLFTADETGFSQFQKQLSSVFDPQLIERWQQAASNAINMTDTKMSSSQQTMVKSVNAPKNTTKTQTKTTVKASKPSKPQDSSVVKPTVSSVKNQGKATPALSTKENEKISKNLSDKYQDFIKFSEDLKKIADISNLPTHLTKENVEDYMYNNGDLEDIVSEYYSNDKNLGLEWMPKSLRKYLYGNGDGLKTGQFDALQTMYEADIESYVNGESSKTTENDDENVARVTGLNNDDWLETRQEYSDIISETVDRILKEEESTIRGELIEELSEVENLSGIKTGNKSLDSIISSIQSERDTKARIASKRTDLSSKLESFKSNNEKIFGENATESELEFVNKFNELNKSIKDVGGIKNMKESDLDAYLSSLNGLQKNIDTENRMISKRNDLNNSLFDFKNNNGKLFSNQDDETNAKYANQYKNVLSEINSAGGVDALNEEQIDSYISKISTMQSEMDNLGISGSDDVLSVLSQIAEDIGVIVKSIEQLRGESEAFSPISEYAKNGTVNIEGLEGALQSLLKTAGKVAPTVGGAIEDVADEAKQAEENVLKNARNTESNNVINVAKNNANQTPGNEKLDNVSVVADKVETVAERVVSQETQSSESSQSNKGTINLDDMKNSMLSKDLTPLIEQLNAIESLEKAMSSNPYAFGTEEMDKETRDFITSRLSEYGVNERDLKRVFENNAKKMVENSAADRAKNGNKTYDDELGFRSEDARKEYIEKHKDFFGENNPNATTYGGALERRIYDSSKKTMYEKLEKARNSILENISERMKSINGENDTSFLDNYNVSEIDSSFSEEIKGNLEQVKTSVISAIRTIVENRTAEAQKELEKTAEETSSSQDSSNISGTVKDVTTTTKKKTTTRKKSRGKQLQENLTKSAKELTEDLGLTSTNIEGWGINSLSYNQAKAYRKYLDDYEVAYKDYAGAKKGSRTNVSKSSLSNSKYKHLVDFEDYSGDKTGFNETKAALDEYLSIFNAKIEEIKSTYGQSYGNDEDLKKLVENYTKGILSDPNKNPNNSISQEYNNKIKSHIKNSQYDMSRYDDYLMSGSTLPNNYTSYEQLKSRNKDFSVKNNIINEESMRGNTGLVSYKNLKSESTNPSGTSSIKEESVTLIPKYGEFPEAPQQNVTLIPVWGEFTAPPEQTIHLKGVIDNIETLRTQIQGLSTSINVTISGVEGITDSDVSNISSLSNSLNTIKDSIGNINLSKISNLSSSFSGFDDKLVRNITSVATKLGEISEKLNTPAVDGSFIQDIKSLSEQAEMIKDIANILKEDKSAVKSAANKSNAKKAAVGGVDKGYDSTDVHQAIVNASNDFIKEVESSGGSIKNQYTSFGSDGLYTSKRFTVTDNTGAETLYKISPKITRDSDGFVKSIEGDIKILGESESSIRGAVDNISSAFKTYENNSVRLAQLELEGKNATNSKEYKNLSSRNKDIRKSIIGNFKEKYGENSEEYNTRLKEAFDVTEQNISNRTADINSKYTDKINISEIDDILTKIINNRVERIKRSAEKSVAEIKNGKSAESAADKNISELDEEYKKLQDDLVEKYDKDIVASRKSATKYDSRLNTSVEKAKRDSNTKISNATDNANKTAASDAKRNSDKQIKSENAIYNANSKSVDSYISRLETITSSSIIGDADQEKIAKATELIEKMKAAIRDKDNGANTIKDLGDEFNNLVGDIEKSVNALNSWNNAKDKYNTKLTSMLTTYANELSGRGDIEDKINTLINDTSNAEYTGKGNGNFAASTDILKSEVNAIESELKSIKTNNVKSLFDNLSSLYSGEGNLEGLVNAFSRLGISLNDYNGDIITAIRGNEKLSESFNKISSLSIDKSIKEAQSDSKLLTSKGASKGGLTKSGTELNNQLSTMVERLKEIKSELSSVSDMNAFSNLSKELLEINQSLATTTSSIANEGISGYVKATSKETSNLTSRISRWANGNSRAMNNSKYSSWYNDINEGFKNSEGSVKDVENYTASLNRLDTEVQSVGANGLSMMDQLKMRAKGVAGWAAIYLNAFTVIEKIKEGISTVKELDSAFVEMQKVSNDTYSSLENFKNMSFDLGDTVGTTGLQMQESAATWMRLGRNPLLGKCF